MKIATRRIDAYEEVEYEPLTVLEVLTEMKDLSELMVDLAYSALVLESDPISEEVEELARRMDWLKYQLRIGSSLGVRTTEEAEQVAGILQIGDASEHIANAASDMIELLDADVDVRAFLGKVLEDADDRVSTHKVRSDVPTLGRTLGALRVESETGVRVIAIKRGKRWVYRPGKEATLADGDVLLIRGQMEGSQRLAELLADPQAGLEVPDE